MPDEGDEGEGLLEELAELTNDAIFTDTVMGWDGDPCLCPDCACPRFRDAADSLICPDCAQGRHWPGEAGEAKR